MSFVAEHALLIAVALPVLVIAGLNLWLAFKGERGTLMMPSAGGFQHPATPALVMGAIAKAHAKRVLATKSVAANEEFVREAA